MNSQYVKYITDFNNQELTFLIDPYYSDGGIYVKDDGSVIDLEGGVIWLRMYQVEDTIIKCHGVMTYDGSKFKVIEIQAQEYPVTAETLKVCNAMLMELQDAPEITIYELRDMLLAKIKNVIK